jgi:hypothetical protein
LASPLLYKNGNSANPSSGAVPLKAAGGTTPPSTAPVLMASRLSDMLASCPPGNICILYAPLVRALNISIPSWHILDRSSPGGTGVVMRINIVLVPGAVDVVDSAVFRDSPHPPKNMAEASIRIDNKSTAFFIFSPFDIRSTQISRVLLINPHFSQDFMYAKRPRLYRGLWIQSAPTRNSTRQRLWCFVRLRFARVDRTSGQIDQSVKTVSLRD